MPIHKQDQLNDFLQPTQLPQNEQQAASWQQANRAWWEENPMRYDFSEAHASLDLTKDFFKEVDHRFFTSAREFLPYDNLPFDALIDFEAIRAKRVLEIGVGMGSHAQLLSAYAGEFVGIDLTERAVAATRARFQCFGLKGEIMRMDAEKMSFPDGSFDWIWSWGVIHHSSDTKRILAQIRRVLAPGGRAVLMVYHRNWWNKYVMAGLFHGLLRGQLLKTGSVDSVMQKVIDGALARFYTVPEWRELVAEVGLTCERVDVYGQKAELLPLPSGAFKSAVLRMIPDPIARIFTHRLRFGTLLVASVKK